MSRHPYELEDDELIDELEARGYRVISLQPVLPRKGGANQAHAAICIPAKHYGEVSDIQDILTNADLKYVEVTASDVVRTIFSLG